MARGNGYTYWVEVQDGDLEPLFGCLPCQIEDNFPTEVEMFAEVEAATEGCVLSVYEVDGRGTVIERDEVSDQLEWTY